MTQAAVEWLLSTRAYGEVVTGDKGRAPEMSSFGGASEGAQGMLVEACFIGIVAASSGGLWSDHGGGDGPLSHLRVGAGLTTSSLNSLQLSRVFMDQSLGEQGMVGSSSLSG